MYKKRKQNITVVELFAGVGGFRIGLEGASDAFRTIWNNQWEPSTVRQDASIIYKSRFGDNGHSNADINSVDTNLIPDHDLMVGGFPCQDYSVASSLSQSKGIEGKKGVLWWQIYRILNEKGDHKPQYLFFENVDRLLSSPAKQRGRDFAIILTSLADLGYSVEWRIINAADYGMPQRRRRTYILGYREDSIVAQKMEDIREWTLFDGVLAKAFPFNCSEKKGCLTSLEGDIRQISDSFNLENGTSPFHSAGTMRKRQFYTVDTIPLYHGVRTNLEDILIDESLIPEEYFIPKEDVPKWEYEKGAKKIMRTSKEGFTYQFSEGGIPFPDPIDKPSRTIITAEGGSSASRFKHVVSTPSSRYRRLVPLELERLNMFPDNHTFHTEISDGRRAFLMGNALVCGVIQEIGKSLFRFIYDQEPISTHPIDMVRASQPQLTLDLFTSTATRLKTNSAKKTAGLDLSKNVLIGYVKPDNSEYFQSNNRYKIYYTGKTIHFPSTIALNKLYYFMPYFKGKGVRDLYIIRIARLGSKAELYPNCGDNESRLIFELELLQSLPDFRSVKLNIFNTYRDTVLKQIWSTE